ncbi:hypothetical protein ACIQF6_26715 [Kitasatospora sp. NPDC092948]|uniref:hypothetical protein n=1 Tax=Kitasatospora sp. NPDC092948 TaxID=3364088 RepID=UPI0037FCDDFA
MTPHGPLGGPYQAWADYLEHWSTARPVDGIDLPALARTDFPADTWQRLMERIQRALDLVLQSWADAMVTAMNAADDEFAAGRALAQARTGLHRIQALAAHPRLPADLRGRLTDTVAEAIRDLQQELERGLARRAARGDDPQQIENRRRTLRDNPLTAVLAAPPPADTGGWAYDPLNAPRRRVLPG